LYGGRTESMKIYYRVKQWEEIRYLDVISLYPYICKYGNFPVGHPYVYVSADCLPDYLGREGIMKCKVLPPIKLYHPLLTYKSNSKQMFPLRSACADTMNQGNCTHTDEDRYIVGICVLDDVSKAIEIGYNLVNVVSYPNTKQRSTSLFLRSAGL
jgi:hypothetical protein